MNSSHCLIESIQIRLSIPHSIIILCIKVGNVIVSVILLYKNNEIVYSLFTVRVLHGACQEDIKETWVWKLFKGCYMKANTIFQVFNKIIVLNDNLISFNCKWPFCSWIRVLLNPDFIIDLIENNSIIEIIINNWICESINSSII